MFEDHFTVDIQPRFRDLDPMGHVNNAVYATYLKQARAEYFRTVVGETLIEVDTVLATLSIDFQQPIELHDDVTVSLHVSQIGNSSIAMDYRVHADGDAAATAETV